MSFSINEFPNASYYDSDLRELVRLYNELTDTYDNLQNEIKQVTDYIDTFKQTTDDIVKEEITITMSLYTQRLIAVENMVEQLEQTTQQYGIDLQKFQPQIDEINTRIKNLTNYFQNLHQELLEEFHDYKNGVGKYIDGRLDNFETEIRKIVTKLDRLDVVNPINGMYEDINAVLADIFQIVSLSFGLTAGEYDAIELTAWEYDKQRVKAIDYSTKGYFIFWELRQGLMRSPWTGTNTHYSNIIYQLTDLHKCGFTAKQYDELQCTAIDFDSWIINAFNYDWFGREMILKREGITAQNYDDKKYTAEKYDNAEITAYRFDNYGNALFTIPNAGTPVSMACNPDVIKPIPNAVQA